MGKFKFQRITWCIAGICFLLGFIINMYEGRSGYLTYILLAIAITASFLNAYNAHKKITTK